LLPAWPFSHRSPAKAVDPRAYALGNNRHSKATGPNSQSHSYPQCQTAKAQRRSAKPDQLTPQHQTCSGLLNTDLFSFERLDRRQLVMPAGITGPASPGRTLAGAAAADV